MKLPKVDIQDHFKGNFHKEEKKTSIDNPWLIISGPTAATSLSLEKMQEAYNQMACNALVYGKGYALIKYSDPEFPIIQECQLIQECQHDPINVGFNQVKLVCKKCDKDL